MSSQLLDCAFVSSFSKRLGLEQQKSIRPSNCKSKPPNLKLDDGWPESEKGKDVDVKYIEERRRCEKISEERMNI